MARNEETDQLVAELRNELAQRHLVIPLQVIAHLHTVVGESERMRASGRMNDALEVCDVTLDEYEAVYGLEFPPLQALYFELEKAYSALDKTAQAAKARKRALMLLERMI
jgi:hypothetical protein